MCWYSGADVFGLMGYRSPSLSLALPTSYNNNKNDNLVVRMLMIRMQVDDDYRGLLFQVKS